MKVKREFFGEFRSIAYCSFGSACVGMLAHSQYGGDRRRRRGVPTARMKPVSAGEQWRVGRPNMGRRTDKKEGVTLEDLSNM